MGAPKVVCVMAIHQRREVTLETLRLLKLQTIVPHIVAVGDSEYERDIVRQVKGVTWVHHANQPLSDKYQAGVNRARQFDPDAIMIGGSDTWVSTKWIEAYWPYLREYGMVGQSKVLVILIRRGSLQMMEWSYLEERNDPLGAGRLISRAVLDAIDWKLFPSGLARGLDKQAWLRVIEAGFQTKQIDMDEACLIGAQSPTWLAMNSWLKLLRSKKASRVYHSNPKRLLARHFPEALVSIANLRRKLNLPECPMEPKVVCVMAIHERTSITVESIKMLQQQTVPMDIVLVGSHAIDREVAEETGCFFYVKHYNKPLGAKHQAGVDIARDLGADVLMTSGSDTWITPNWLELALPHLEKFGAVGKSQWYAMHLQSNRLEIISRQYGSHRIHEPVGVGRLISRKVLDKVDWQIYPPTQNRGLDGAVRRKLQKANCSPGILNHIRDIMTLGVKGPWPVLTSWNRVKNPKQLIRLPDVAMPARWLDKHFPGSLGAIARLRNTLWEIPLAEARPRKRPPQKRPSQKRQNMIYLRYVGHKMAEFAVWGEETNTRYQFGPHNTFMAYVYEEDATALIAYRKRRGRKGMIKQFERVKR